MTPRWVPLIVDGKYNEAVRRSTARASGAYAVRRRDSHTVVYVGESSRGVLWKTIIRHFQPPGATRASFVASDPSAYEIAIWKTSTGKRSRAAKRSADQRAMAAQARWIETLRPFHNTDDGKAKAKETDEYRATMARYEAEDRERGAFDGLINPAINVPRFIFGVPKGTEADDFDRDAMKVYASIGKAGTWREAKLVPLEDIDADPVWKPERLEALRAKVAAGEQIPIVHLVRDSPSSRWKINDGIHRIALSKELGMTHVAASCITYATAAERAEFARKNYEHWRALTMKRKGYLSSKKSGHGNRNAWADLRYQVLSEQLAKAKKEKDRWERAAKREVRPTSENPGADIFAATAAKRADRDRRLAAWVAARGTRPYEAIGRGGVRVLVSPDPSKPGRWRVTRFEGDEPTGHNEAATFEEAATFAERDLGAPIPEVNDLDEVTARKTSSNPVARHEALPRTLTALGLLTLLSYEDSIVGELVELRWTLAQAPTLAVDERGRLRVVYVGRVVRPSSKVERAAYRKLHWGQDGRGEVSGGGVAVPPFRTLGRGVSVTYTTRKGIDRKLVDYVHPWGEGGPRKFVPPLVVEHHCGSKRCACEGAIAFAGGTYVVEERGIVG